MTPDEARAINERSKAELAALKKQVASLAAQYSGPTFFAMFELLIEMVCSAQGPNFTEFNKKKFYTAVIGYLAHLGYKP